MNLTIFDLLIFLKRKFIYCLIIVIVSFSSFFAFNNFKDPKTVLTFEVDLREWNNLNDRILLWLENYKSYPDEIKYSILTSFDSAAVCKNNENVISVMFCTVEGSNDKLNQQFSRFEKKSKIILKKQLDQMLRDINYFDAKIKNTREFILDSSTTLKEKDEITKLTDYSYIAYNQISKMETDLVILKQVYEIFEPLVLIKNMKIKEIEHMNIPFYSFLFSMLCLFLFIIVGLAYQVSKKKS